MQCVQCFQSSFFNVCNVFNVLNCHHIPHFSMLAMCSVFSFLIFFTVFDVFNVFTVFNFCHIPHFSMFSLFSIAITFLITFSRQVRFGISLAIHRSCKRRCCDATTGLILPSSKLLHRLNPLEKSLRESTNITKIEHQTVMA